MAFLIWDAKMAFLSFLRKWLFFYEMMVILGSSPPPHPPLNFLLDEIVNFVLVPKFGGSGVEWGLFCETERWGTTGLGPRTQTPGVHQLDHRLCREPGQ